MIFISRVCKSVSKKSMDEIGLIRYNLGKVKGLDGFKELI